MMANELKKISVIKLFEDDQYMIPIYQRNYAWDEVQILQLMEDIESAITDSDKNYFLGNLIVNQTDNNVYEVIDGQQRLTTLYLLCKYLKMSVPKDSLRFEAREKSNRTLRGIGLEAELHEDLSSAEILNGFQIINGYFNNKNVGHFIEKLKKVFLIRVQVPKNIDLNHYFEIMNTRGEQLELHEIVKAKLMEALTSNIDKKTAALIWEKCSDMNSYVQMNFDAEQRKQIFSYNWSNLNREVYDFDSLKHRLSMKGEDQERKSLLALLRENQMSSEAAKTLTDENERFESTISFPNFLLQVNSAMRSLGEEEASLDDKRFLENLSWAWSSPRKAKEYLFTLLKSRVLFDQYVLKREFARDYKDSGKWSLQKLEKYRDKVKKTDKPKYVSTLGDEDNDNKKLRMLQAGLRITYTSPKTMHWITLVIARLLEDESTDILEELENYCRTKVLDSDFTNKKGFDIARIVFTYLDYLLYRDGYKYKGKSVITPLQESWQFQFRNSIEHFYPQNPSEGDTWEFDDLNGFGNLALITVSGNSKFSNLPPTGKISSFPSIMNQSLKLLIMEHLVRMDNGRWTCEKAEEHRKEMTRILS